MLKVIKIAEAQVGYLEKASNRDLDSKTGNAGYNNYTKYGETSTISKVSIMAPNKAILGVMYL